MPDVGSHFVLLITNDYVRLCGGVAVLARGLVNSGLLSNDGEKRACRGDATRPSARSVTLVAGSNSVLQC